MVYYLSMGRYTDKSFLRRYRKMPYAAERIKIMTEKETAEIRRTLTFDKTAITTIRGCYVNGNKEMIATFDQSVGLMPQEELEKYLSIFKRTLSGTPDRHLLDISFTNEQVADSDEHRLLMSLKNSGLKDEEAVGKFYKSITDSVAMDENYVILLAYNVYDIPFRATDGRKVDADSSSIYSCVHCAVCPVKMTKSALTYDASEKVFHNNTAGSVIASPALGFLFPAFDGRQTNIYNALYYTGGNDVNLHEDFIDAIFRVKPPMSATEQSTAFRTVLADSLDKDCSFGVAKKLHNEICEKIEEHKATKQEEPLALSKYQVREILSDCGIAEEKLNAFTDGYDENFGKGTDLSPRNLVDPKQFEVRTPEVVIKVTPGHSDLLETRVIDGTKYILIRADEGVELNGLNVNIAE